MPKPDLSPKEHYQRLRIRSCAQLWDEDVAAFDRAAPRDRMKTVAVIRAVGVVFSESGTDDEREQARQWLRTLLHDPEEKVRRYAMTALPKIGADAHEESDLLNLADQTTSDREKKSLGRTLEKIGGAATLEKAATGCHDFLDRPAQKAAGNLARFQRPSRVRLDAEYEPAGPLRLHLRSRNGLETLVEREIREQPLVDSRLTIERVEPGLVVVSPTTSFTLADLHALRCFGSIAFALGAIKRGDGDIPTDALADLITAPLTRRLLETFTDGPIRYRLEFSDRGHQRRAIRELGNRVFARCPALINDSRDAPWQIDIHETGATWSLELSPRLRPDPRFAYRLHDVPAASHPPLAAGMARLAGAFTEEVVWDPFCGSGLELIESALRGNVRGVIGTDLSPPAIDITRDNFSAAITTEVSTAFVVTDFRDYRTIPALARSDVSLVITNPPLGRRVPIPNLRGLIADLLTAADSVLRPGGRLVFVNPLSAEPVPTKLKRDFRQKIDLGGFSAHLERYVKNGPR